MERRTTWKGDQSPASVALVRLNTQGAPDLGQGSGPRGLWMALPASSLAYMELTKGAVARNSLFKSGISGGRSAKMERPEWLQGTRGQANLTVA
jgi:hypothetical protein